MADTPEAEPLMMHDRVTVTNPEYQLFDEYLVRYIWRSGVERAIVGLDDPKTRKEVHTSVYLDELRKVSGETHADLREVTKKQ